MRYYSHIDGLRAVAILPVVAFHADIELFSGGFTGVDVFFVISGYLITSIIATEIAENRFSLLEFYKRRALRILPAYGTMTLAVLGASYFLSLPEEAARLGQSVMASAFFVSNIYFWQVTDYFSPDSIYEPLIHTWTLSIEEQYYILIPLLLIVIARFAGGRFVVIFTGLSLGSFALSAAMPQALELANFYLLPTRAWEFGAGSLIALLGVDPARRRRFAELIALVGAGLLLWSFFGLDKNAPFPGPNAAFAVVGATLLIVFAANTFVGRLLTAGPVVAVGKISYSLYLWHWPIIVFYRSWFGPVLGPWDVAILLTASFVAATLSYYLVEQPFRTDPMRGAGAKRVTAAAAVVLVGVAGAGGFVTQQGPAWGGHSAEVRAMSAYIGYRTDREAHPCFLYAARVGTGYRVDLEDCLTLAEQQPNVLFLGDSHAEHLMGAFEEVFDGVNLVTFGATGCLPEPNPGRNFYCPKLYREAFADHLAPGSFDMIIVSMRWQERHLDQIDALIAAWQLYGTDVVVLGPSPEYLAGFPRLMTRAMIRGIDNIDHFLDEDVFALDRQMSQKTWSDGVRYISMIERLCPKGQCQQFTETGTPMLSDYGHYTDASALEITERLRQDILLDMGDITGRAQN